MCGKGNVGRGRGQNTPAMSSASKNVGASTSTSTGSGNSSQVPGGSSSSRVSRPKFSLPARGYTTVTAYDQAFVDYMCVEGAEDSDNITVSGLSVDSSVSTVTWRGGTAHLTRCVSSSPSLPPTPTATQMDSISHGEELCEEESEALECVAEVVEVESEAERSTSGTDGGRRAGDTVRRHGGYAGGKQGAQEVRAERSGVEDEEEFDIDDDIVLDRTWEPVEEELTCSEQEGSGSVSEEERSRGRGRRNVKRNRRRAAGLMSSGDGEAAACSVKKTSRGGAQSVSSVSVRYSDVWKFFSTLPDAENVAVCRLCKQKVSRGQGPSIGTTSLRRHMERHHRAAWDSRHAPQREENAAAVAATDDDPPDPSQQSNSQFSSTGSTFSGFASSSPKSCPLPPRSRQLSIVESMSSRQQYSPSHPVVLRLNSHLAKLLVAQALPYHLVDSTAFRQLMGCAQPRWRIPSRHYFSNKAVPALHNHVAERVGHSMNLSVCRTVHATVDTWSSSYGQGQYMSFTAHWVNILQNEAPPQRGQEIVVTPPRLRRSGSPTDTTRRSSCGSSSSTDILHHPTGKSVASPPPPPSFHLCKIKRCHAVLHLLSLGEKSHTAEELLPCLQQEFSHWLSGRHLTLGNVVADNGTNIVKALRLGGMTHCPCLAHVLNLVV